MSEPTQPECPVREGDILAGKYRVEKVLGVGGMGVVVAAMHTELEERVALKFLLPSAAQNPAVVARFQREAKAAAKIKSQHVARVSDWGKLENGTPYIVMEYLEGIDLADMLERDGRLRMGDAVDYVLQACEAIAEAHAAGFVHRDLKPANLYLANQADGTAIIKVLDFGISKAVIGEDSATTKPGSLTRTTDIFGSPMYMSPEQLKSSRDVDARADIWALGVIVYELVTGRAPFDRPTVAETFGAILYEKPESIRKRVPEVPEELEHVVFQCLEKDLAARLPNVAELVRDLLPFAASGTRVSLERTSRVLRRAGVTVKSAPPPSRAGDAAPLSQAASAALAPQAGLAASHPPGPPMPGAQGGAPAGDPASRPASSGAVRAAQSVGAKTGTTWDTGAQHPPRAKANTRAAVVTAAAVVVLGSAGLFAFQRWGRSGNGAAAAPSPDRPTTTATAQPPPPQPPPPATTAAPPATVQSDPRPQPSSAPPAQEVPPVAPHGTHAHAADKHGKGAPPPPATQAPATPPPPPATAAPAPPPPAPVKPKSDDTDGFGDRK